MSLQSPLILASLTSLERLAKFSHRLFLLRSFNKEELADNMRRLTKEAPKGASCPKGEPR